MRLEIDTIWKRTGDVFTCTDTHRLMLGSVRLGEVKYHPSSRKITHVQCFVNGKTLNHCNSLETAKSWVEDQIRVATIWF